MSKSNVGISMIALIITIVVLVILTGVIVLKLTDTNIMELGNEGSFKQNIRTYETDLADYIGNQDFEQHGKYDATMLYANSSVVKIAGEEVTGTTIKDVIPSLSHKDISKFIVEVGKLKYVGTKAKEQKWAKEAGIELGIGYVQKGLNLWLDGIQNTENGHNAAATEWKDLSGRGNDAKFVNSNIHWNDKGVQLAQAEKNYLSTKTQNGLYGENMTVSATYQLTGDITDVYYGGLLSRSSGIGYEDNYLIYVNNLSAPAGRIGFGGTRLQDIGGSYTIVKNKTYTQTMSTQYDAQTNNTTIRFYLDDRLLYQKTLEGKPYVNTNHVTRIGTYIGNAQFFEGEIYSVRVYDRTLSEEEVSHNAAIDKTRFGI